MPSTSHVRLTPARWGACLWRATNRAMLGRNERLEVGDPQGGITMVRVRTLVMVVSTGLLLAGCDDWPMFRFGPARTGYNPVERAISATNVAGLAERFTVTLLPYVPTSMTSPVVANGVGYVGLTIDDCYQSPPVEV